MILASVKPICNDTMLAQSLPHYWAFLNNDIIYNRSEKPFLKITGITIELETRR